MAMILASSERTRLRVSRANDLDFVLEAENHPDNRNYIGQWTREQHRSAQEGTDTVHLIIEADLAPAGYLIIAGLEHPAQSIELIRLVITDKGKGLGRDALRLVKRCAFHRWNAHRLWLDVRSNNPRARKLYEEEGFVVEGTLRECLKLQDTYVSVSILSILASEYRDGH
ncbi:MAG: GCN5-related N-acetyltransferase [Paenibacillaceae bacterium]|jgi:RimJ/RimL family protein N-acetyltransferase|nr:GCN5-related N-acetyltransferase [Paenibacillaceae bacterium]